VGSRVITSILANIQMRDKCVRNVINLFIGLLIIMMTLLKLNSIDLVTNGGVIITDAIRPVEQQSKEREVGVVTKEEIIKNLDNQTLKIIMN
jgi:hypothetical protein